MRPQRGSRATSSTGASVWRAPTARICSRITRAHALGERRAPTSRRARSPAGTGRRRARRSPAVLSSCTIAGMPSRVSSTQEALDRVRERGALARAEPGRRADARDLRRCRARGARARAARENASSSDELRRPHAAELRELLVERHAREEVCGALFRRKCGVSVAARSVAASSGQRVPLRDRLARPPPSRVAWIREMRGPLRPPRRVEDVRCPSSRPQSARRPPAILRAAGIARLGSPLPRPGARARAPQEAPCHRRSSTR